MATLKDTTESSPESWPIPTFSLFNLWNTARPSQPQLSSCVMCYTTSSRCCEKWQLILTTNKPHGIMVLHDTQGITYNRHFKHSRTYNKLRIFYKYRHIAYHYHQSINQSISHYQSTSQVSHTANDGGATTLAIHCWPSSIHRARPNGLELLAGWPPRTAGLWVL